MMLVLVGATETATSRWEVTIECGRVVSRYREMRAGEAIDWPEVTTLQDIVDLMDVRTDGHGPKWRVFDALSQEPRDRLIADPIDFPKPPGMSSLLVTLPRSPKGVRVTLAMGSLLLGQDAVSINESLLHLHANNEAFWVDGATEAINGDTLKAWIEWSKVDDWLVEVTRLDAPIDWTGFTGPCGQDDTIFEAREDARNHAREMACLDAAVSGDPDAMVAALMLACERDRTIGDMDMALERLVIMSSATLVLDCATYAYNGIPWRD